MSKPHRKNSEIRRRGVLRDAGPLGKKTKHNKHCNCRQPIISTYWGKKHCRGCNRTLYIKPGVKLLTTIQPKESPDVRNFHTIAIDRAQANFNSSFAKGYRRTS